MFLVAALAAGCRAPASELPQGVVLRYGVSHFQGSVHFTVRADGSAEYQSSGAPDEPQPVERIAKVSAEELQALAKVLREKNLCSLTSSRSTGVPDEARPSISVRLEDLDCKVRMWDNEYRDDPDAQACLRAVESLGSAIRERGTPVAGPR
jgi:hypothetical protein